MKKMNRDILNIAIPSIISNITVPLLSLVDVTIMGHLGSAAYIGAIAVGGMIFNILYWLLGFLRMGTSGLTSQAYGKDDKTEIINLLIRAVTIGGSIGIIFILCQLPIRTLAFIAISPSEDVALLASTYYNICIWGAPATLALYGFTGWFIGMQNSRIPMFIAISQNVVNIGASLSLVYFFNMKVEGVAYGTLISQYVGLLLAILLWRKKFAHISSYLEKKTLWAREKMERFFIVNRDIFLRTLCIIITTFYFTSQGSQQGEVILAVNTLLMQFFTLFSYIMDGFAYAGEALSGKYIGEKNKLSFQEMKSMLFRWGTLLSMGFTLAYIFGGENLLSLLTNEKSIISAAITYLPWAAAIPFISFSAFIWDGIFIGATATKEMLISMSVATICFFAVFLITYSHMGNNGLWLAFLTYLGVRGLIQAMLIRKVERRSF